MSDERLDAYANWLRANQDKAGSPEFVRVAQAFRELRAAPAAPTAQPGMLENAWKAAEPYATDAMNMLGRVGTNLAVGPLDLAALAANKLTEKLENTSFGRMFGGTPGERLPYASQELQQTMGIQPQRPDASYPERLLEAGLNVITGRAAMGGSASPRLPRPAPAVPVTPTAPPSFMQGAVQTALPAAGGVFGEDIGRAYGGEDGAILGSILGGGGASVLGNVASRPLSYFGNENAGAIYDAGQRVGARVTAGQVGDGGVKWMEKSIGALPIAGMGVNRAREQASNGIQNARDNAVNTITGGRPVGIEPGQRGDALITGSRMAESRIQKALSDEQQTLESGIGSNTPVRVQPAIDASRQQAMSTDLTNAAPIMTRAQQLFDMTPEGFAARDPSAPIRTVPYGVVKDFRTNLNSRSEGLDPVPNHLQGPITDQVTAAMREAARFRGLEPDFDAANIRYAQAQPTLGALREVGGEFNARANMYNNGMNSSQAESVISQGLRAPERITPFADNLDPRAWDYVAGSTIARMGEQNRGGFRPDNFAMEWGGPGQKTGVNPQSAAALTQNAPKAQGMLDDAATLGRAYNIPQASEGLSRAIGGLTMAGYLANALQKTVGTVGGLVVGPLPGFALESGPVVRGIAGRATPIADALYNRMPGMMTGAQYTLPPEAQQ